MTVISKISKSQNKLLLIVSSVLLSVLIISFVQSVSFEVTNQPEPTVSGTSVVPGNQDRGSSVVIASTVTDVSGVIYVRVQIKNGAGITVANINLFDDGAHSDGAAGDNVYGSAWIIPATLPVGNYKIFITASDTLGNVYQTGVTIPFGDAVPKTEETNFNVTAPPVTCPDATCDVAGGECTTCLADCSVADCCGFDPLCNAGVGENNGNCPGDCPAGCVPDGCNGVCPAGCAPAGDPDCPAGGCCGDGTCDAGEDCSTCADCACTAPQICCAGTCQNPTCSGNVDCDNGNTCTTDTCNNAGTCIASCSNSVIVACNPGDGCCPAGCANPPDTDCGCTESWTCTAWSACAGGTQTRTCTDSNSCGTIVSKPAESQACGVLPASFDWSHKEIPGAAPAGGADWMSPVKHQGSCGSCWAFSAVGAMEGKYNIEQNDPNSDRDLAERYLVSTCFGSGDCGGGWPDSALTYIRDNGITYENCFPYLGSDCDCNLRCATWNTQLWKIGSFVYKNNPTVNEMKSAIVNHGPLSGYVKLGGAGNDWVGDIYICGGSSSPNHAIVITGYDDVGGYWVVKNSWGDDWFDDPDRNGYYKVGYGECGIESWGFYYPVGVTSP